MGKLHNQQATCTADSPQVPCNANVINILLFEHLLFEHVGKQFVMHDMWDLHQSLTGAHHGEDMQFNRYEAYAVSCKKHTSQHKGLPFKGTSPGRFSYHSKCIQATIIS